MRADGRTGYSRLKGREYTSGIAIFGEAIWYKLPKTAGEDGPVEGGAQEGQPAPPDPAAPNHISTSTAAQTGGVDTDVMESGDIELAVSSRAHATAATIRPFVTGGDETMEQEGAGLPVCSLLIPVDEIPVSYVATHELDDRPVYDHKTGELLSPHLVKVGRQTEPDAMTRHQLFDRLVAMEEAHGVRFDTFAGTALHKCIKIIISRAASIKNTRYSRVLALLDSSVAFWHALLPEDEPTAMYPPRGEEEAGYMWQLKRAMDGTRRASRLVQEHMKGVSKKQDMQHSRYVRNLIVWMRY